MLNLFFIQLLKELNETAVTMKDKLNNALGYEMKRDGWNKVNKAARDIYIYTKRIHITTEDC